ncbi:hypothetical protein TOPH_05262, partial [Tolypocladium ophioglossoides CBS 100239]
SLLNVPNPQTHLRPQTTARRRGIVSTRLHRLLQLCGLLVPSCRARAHSVVTTEHRAQLHILDSPARSHRHDTLCDDAPEIRLVCIRQSNRAAPLCATLARIPSLSCVHDEGLPSGLAPSLSYILPSYFKTEPVSVLSHTAYHFHCRLLPRRPGSVKTRLPLHHASGTKYYCGLITTTNHHQPPPPSHHSSLQRRRRQPPLSNSTTSTASFPPRVPAATLTRLGWGDALPRYLTCGGGSWTVSAPSTTLPRLHPRLHPHSRRFRPAQLLTTSSTL